MSRAKETVGKKEKEKKKAQKKREKEERREERKANNNKGKSLEDMMMYLDENGNLSPTPPDPTKKFDISLEDIQLGAAIPDPEEDGLRKGIVTFYNEAKGYGFINDLRSQKSIFFHANNALEPIKERNKVSFEIEPGPKGPTAVKVSVIK
ncbi:cold-shock protein [Polluticoccus soli]|uniref:cold-shock protein n=1 Tax=Polluticoccus soli TaxID=3034150 RepID=UPI0023E13F63|nr:cold shock domain-containing protein [Flavipsychrobacter sp. JY13-12]